MDGVDRVMRCGIRFFITIMLSVLVGSMSAYASEKTFQLHIPVLDAADALDVLAEKTEHSLFYPVSTSSPVKTNALNGSYTLPQALDALLEGTHLNAVVTSKRVIVISLTQVSQQVNSTIEGKQMYKKNKLSVGVLAALASFFGGGIQVSQAADGEDGQVLEEIVVHGIKYDLQNALKAKRNANTIVDVISSEDIGSFPDNNVAESLQHLPGITITREDGEGAEVSIRGFAPGQNLTLINGHAASSAGFGSYGAASRAFNYALLPSEIASKIEVFKSPEARITEGGVGGTINVHTRKPLDQKDNLLLSGSLSGNYSELSDETEPKVSFLGSWKNDAETFGVLFSAGYQGTSIRRDSTVVQGYSSKKVQVPGEVGVRDKVLVPHYLRSELFLQDRERTAGMMEVQFRPTDNLEFSLNGFYSEVSGDNKLVNYMTLHHQLQTTGGGSDISDITIDPNNTATSINWSNDSKKKEFQTYTFDRSASIQSQGLNLSTKWSNDDWTVKTGIGFSDSEGGAGRIRASAFQADANLVTRVTGKDVSFEVRDPATGEPIDGTDANRFALQLFLNDLAKDKTTQDFIWFDVEKIVDDSFIQMVYAGVKYTEFGIDRSRFQKRHLNNPATKNLLGTLTLDQVGTTSVPGDFLNGVSTAALDSFLYADNAAVETAVDQLFANDPALDFKPAAYSPGQTFKIREEMLSAYVQVDFGGELGAVGWRGNVGIRMSDQETKSSTFSNRSSAEDLASLNYDRTLSGEHVEFIPSANLIFDFPDDFVLRLAASEVISRPSYTDLARSLSLNGDETDPGSTLTARAGNPDLKPFKAKKYDISAEYYYGDASAVSAALFYYDIESFITDETEEVDLFNDGNIWTVKRPVNGEGGSIKGVEASFLHHFVNLPGVLDGLGVRFTYTHIDSQGTKVDPLTNDKLQLQGLSKNSYNFSLLYTHDAWNARIGYNHRSKYHDVVQRSLPRYTDDSENLSAKVTYKVNKKLSVFIQGNNLTDHETYRYIGNPDRPFSRSHTGRTMIFGMKSKF